MLGETISFLRISCRLLGPAALLVIGLCTACSNPTAPETTARAYIDAVQDGRCEVARGLLSARTQQALEFLSRSRERAGNSTVEEYYCGRLLFHQCKVSDLALVGTDGGAAKVSMPCGRTQDGLFPGSVSPFLKYEPRDIDLVRENGEWRVVDAFVVRHFETHEREQRAVEEALSKNEYLRKEYEQRKARETVPQR